MVLCPEPVGHNFYQRKEQTIMKRSPFYLLAFLLMFSFLCCTQEKTEKERILCRINGYELPLDDFQFQLAEEVELDHDFKLTQKAKQEFLEELIKKELIIQEAKKLKLDRREKFVRAIERHWESTLIRDLMDLKCDEISKKIYVSEEDINAQYSKMKNLDENLPSLDEIRDPIRQQLKQEKQTLMLEQWVSALREKASIEINQDLL